MPSPSSWTPCRASTPSLLSPSSASSRKPSRRSALAWDLRLSAHRRATRPDAASTARLIPRKRYAPAARGSSPLGDSSRRDHRRHPGGLLDVPLWGSTVTPTLCHPERSEGSALVDDCRMVAGYYSALNARESLPFPGIPARGPLCSGVPGIPGPAGGGGAGDPLPCAFGPRGCGARRDLGNAGHDRALPAAALRVERNRARARLLRNGGGRSREADSL